MSQLDSAIMRLGMALDVLERAATSPGRAAAADGGAPAWRKEREALLARIAGLEDELRSASSLNEEIETRLDDAVGEIRAALGH